MMQLETHSGMFKTTESTSLNQNTAEILRKLIPASGTREAN